MYIVNIENTNNTFECGKMLASYFKKNNVNLLSIKDNKYYFSKSSNLKELYDKAPFYLKLKERWE